MDNHTFCRGLLKNIRFEAKEKGIVIPEICSPEISPENYAVFIGDDFYDEYNTCCAFEARAMAIGDYIHQMDKELTAHIDSAWKEYINTRSEQ